jgi:hypothetical protein
MFLFLLFRNSEKDYENKNSNNNAQRFEILLKPFEKNKKNDKKIENVLEEDNRLPISQANGKTSNQSKEMNSFYLNKENKITTKNKVTPNVGFNGNKSNRKIGGILT